MKRIMTAAIFVAALGSGVLGGFILAFSDVMGGLSRVPAASGIAAMNEMNVVVVQDPIFFLALLGTPALAVVLAVIALMRIGQAGSWAILLGALLVVIGVFGVTVVIHVPMNDALAALDPASAAGAEFWETYVDRWMAWNHVRMVAGVAAAAAFMLALIARAGARPSTAI